MEVIEDEFEFVGVSIDIFNCVDIWYICVVIEGIYFNGIFIYI